MAERPEDFNLPHPNVLKIIRDTLPDGVSIEGDARSAIARGTAMFILYLTTQATASAQQENRDTINAQDIVNAASMMGFDEYIEDVIEFHSEFMKEQARKNRVKKMKAKKQAAQRSMQMSMNQEADFNDQEADAGDYGDYDDE